MVSVRQLVGMSILVLCFPTFSAERNEQTLQEDKTHINTWNGFAKALIALHEEQLKGRDIREESSVGGYQDAPEFYREVSYIDRESGILLSKIQWEAGKNEQIPHTIEVYVTDSEGRVSRDYAAAFLPNYRNAPVQTLINLHHYQDGLHGFRQFDAGGDRIYEYCEGTADGKTVQIRLFEDDLFSYDKDIEKILQSQHYKACFGDLPLTGEHHTTPG